MNLQVYLFFIVKGHKNGGNYISHSLLTGKLVSRFPTHHQSCKYKANLTGEMLALENKQRKTHELWLVTTTVLKIFEAKRLTFPEPHKPVTAKKIGVWQRSKKDTFPLEITHVCDDECQRETTRLNKA